MDVGKIEQLTTNRRRADNLHGCIDILLDEVRRLNKVIAEKEENDAIQSDLEGLRAMDRA